MYTTKNNKFYRFTNDNLNNLFIKNCVSNAIFLTAYDLYTDKITINEISQPNKCFYNDNCCISLRISSHCIFGDIKKQKLVTKDFSFTDSDGNTLLHKAISENNEKFVKELIKAGLDVSAKNYNGETALDIAIEKGNVKLQNLLEKAKKF